MLFRKVLLVALLGTVCCIRLVAQADSSAVYFERAQTLCVAGQYDKAISILTTLYEQSDNNPEQLSIKARAAMQIGIIYFFMQDYDSALVYYKKARIGAEELGSVTGMSIACINIGNIYQKRHDYEQALELYNECLAYNENDGEVDIVASAKFNIASCYEEMGNMSLAYKGYKEAAILAEQAEDYETEAVCLINTALYESVHGIGDRGESEIEKSISIAKEHNMLQVLHNAIGKHMEMCANAGDYKGAYKESLKAQELADSLFHIESMEMLNEFQIKYETREKEAQIEAQNITIIHERRIRMFALSLALMLAGLVLLLRRYVSLEKRRRKIVEEINQAKDMFYSIISHDLKNPVNAQNNVIEMMDENFDDLPADVIRQEVSELHQSSESLKELLENLLAWSRIQTGRLKTEPVNFNIASVVRDVEKIARKQLVTKNIAFSSSVPAKAMAYGDLNMASTIVRNLVCNAIKFTLEGGSISVSAKEEESMWKITVSDTGVGMSQDVIESIFKVESVISTPGTSGETGTGLGLIVCKDMTIQNGGQMSVDSKDGEGTSISFTIPKA